MYFYSATLYCLFNILACPSPLLYHSSPASLSQHLPLLNLYLFPPPTFPLLSPDHQPLRLLAVLLRHGGHQATAPNNVSYAVNRQTPPNIPAGNFHLYHSHTRWWPAVNGKEMCKLQTAILQNKVCSVLCHE